MTDNPSYGGGQGQGRPGDDYYDDPYAPPQEDPQPRRTRAAATPSSAARYPDQGGYGAPEQRPRGLPGPRRLRCPRAARRLPRPGRLRPARRLPRPARRLPRPGGATATQRRLPRAARRLPRPRRLRRPGRLPATRGGYGAPEPARRLPPSKAATASQPAATTEQRRRYADYGGGTGSPGRRPAPAHPSQRGGYPEQGGLRPGLRRRPGYGRQDYGTSPIRPTGLRPGVRRPSAGGYGEPERDYDYGQPAGTRRLRPGAATARAATRASGSAVTLQLDDGSGRTYQLREGPNVIGRGQDAQFRLPDTGVSRRHLEIRWDGHVALLSDLELHQRHHRQQRAGAGMAVGRRRRDPAGTLRDHRPDPLSPQARRSRPASPASTTVQVS